MLWHKAWLETRWRFVIGLVLLMMSACGTVLVYPRVLELLDTAPRISASGEIGRQIREGVALARDYRGYVWSQWFRQNLVQMWTFFAVLLASGSVLSQAFGAGTLFTLSLPATRHRLVSVRVLTALAELFVLAFVPSLLIPLLSPAVGQSYGIGDALVHGACLFVAGIAFFSFTFLLSTVFSDIWRPLLIACATAMLLSLVGQVSPDLGRYSIFRVMNGETYFRGGGLPWPGLLASIAASAAFLYTAVQNVAQADF
jgi:ABC-type transport system involved in multi-copper enzyme maturation permease subunit